MIFLNNALITPQKTINKDLQFEWWAFMPEDRNALHEAIANRFHEMLNNGLIDEVKKLYERGDLSLSHPAMRSVNYRQIWYYLAGDLSYHSMLERAIIATRQLAKRQMTWIRSFAKVKTILDLLSFP